MSGRLPTWDHLVPRQLHPRPPADPRQRHQVLHDLPELPWKILSGVLPAPGGAWNAAKHIYLQLSAAYQPAADHAEERGYQLRRRDADHQAMVTQACDGHGPASVGIAGIAGES